MKIYEKRKLPDGTRVVFLFGIRLFGYASVARGKVRDYGSGNEIRGCLRGTTVRIFGDENEIVLGAVARKFRAYISIGMPDHPVRRCQVMIGDGCSAEGLGLFLRESGSKIVIGRDCQVSNEVEIRASDGHAILDASGAAINRGHAVRIGDHCWLGARSTILKNVVIPDGSIVGASAVVTPSSVRDAHGEAVILAGNPARIVKRGVCWDRRRPDEFEEALPASARR